VSDHLRTLAASGTRAVVVAPTGFVSDHLEVLWDLDEEARETAGELGLAFARAATPGVHREFVTMVRDLVEERVADAAPAGCSPLGRTGTDCPAGCCPAPRRRAA
jgi:protoporphyrin/coproporphyrin ferrochelatase